MKKRSKYGLFTRLFHKKIGKIIKKHEVTFLNIFCAVGLELKKAESEAFRFFFEAGLLKKHFYYKICKPKINHV